MSYTLGMTFSHTHLKWLNLSISEAIDEAIKAEFSTIRLGCYWREIEKNIDQYDFSQLDFLLQRCEKAKQSVVMNVGVKSPRWPEYYWPQYLKSNDIGDSFNQERILFFLEKVVTHLSHYSCIKWWQVENEPLDIFGKDDSVIPNTFLNEEINLVRKLDKRPILLTLWANDMRKRRTFDQLVGLADYIGLDIYYKQLSRNIVGRDVYVGPKFLDKYLKRIVDKYGDKIIVSELQAEPWERTKKKYPM